MQYYLLSCLAATTPAIAREPAGAHYARMLGVIQQNLTAAGVLWRHAYSYPGSDYYDFYLASDLPLEVICEKFADFGTILSATLGQFAGVQHVAGDNPIFDKLPRDLFK